MNKRIQNITETRDWAKIVFALTFGVAVIILAAKGELNDAALLAAIAGLR